VATGVAPDPTGGPYHHGDLRRALLEAGVALARAGGPEAVALRAATRAAGVSPNAAYRHFADRDALLAAVSLAAQAQVAAAMEDELARHAPTGDARADASAALRAVGTGYLRFAGAEPGLFRAAFTVSSDLRNATSEAGRGPGGRTPFEVLGDALDALVAAGALPAQDRPGADLLAWSAVHGLATLLLTGPLRALDAATVAALSTRLVSVVERGLTSARSHASAPSSSPDRPTSSSS
jgi:AcrR family transcriptional regulator